MSSNNISLEEDSLDNSCEVLSNKETQTSSTYITDSFTLNKGPSRPLPKSIDKSNVESVVVVDNNILDCRVIKDPSDSKQVILTESFIKDIANVSNSQESESSGQTYCKEVVLPYLKPHLNDCEDNVDSLEKLIQDALEDLPDYQPCHEVYDGQKDIQEKTTNSTSKSRKMGIASKTEKEKNTPETAKKCRKNIDDQSTPLSSQSSSPNLKKNTKSPENSDSAQLPKVVADDQCTNKDYYTNVSTESITKCVKESLTALKRTASSCLEKIEVVIGIKKPENPDEKPTYYAIEKPKVECRTSHNVQTETGNSLKSLKNLLNNHNEKISTLKETVKDLAGKFYKTSKDAVTLITSESAKLLSKDKTEAYSAENANENQPIRKEKNLRNISADSIASFLFQKAENKPVKNEHKVEAPPESAASNSSPPAISPGHIIGKITNDIINKKIDKSSPFDKPLPKEVLNKLPEPPESRIPTVSAIDHTPDPPSASNMFMIIKSKIFSIFRDDSEKTEPGIQESNQDDDDDEEDPFERFMEQ